LNYHPRFTCEGGTNGNLKSVLCSSQVQKLLIRDHRSLKLANDVRLTDVSTITILPGLASFMTRGVVGENARERRSYISYSNLIKVCIFIQISCV